jgi:hypothetical protein
MKVRKRTKIQEVFRSLGDETQEIRKTGLWRLRGFALRKELVEATVRDIFNCNRMIGTRKSMPLLSSGPLCRFEAGGKIKEFLQPGAI